MITPQGLEQLGFVNQVDFIVQNDGDGDYIAEWKSKKEKPTEEEIEKAHDEWQKDHDAKQYQRDRQYPSIGDQLDMQYWDQLNGTTTWKDAITKVKADHPKP